MNRSHFPSFLDSLTGRVRFLWMALITAAVPVIGCGADSSRSTVPASGAREPSSQVESPKDPPPGGAVNLGDFPVPAPPGGAVGRVMSDSVRGITYGASDMDAIVAFYENWLSEAGLKSQFGVVVTESSGQMSLQASTEDERTFYKITATPSPDNSRRGRLQ